MAERGRGTTFSRIAQLIGGVVSVSGGGVSSDTIETTELAPTDGFRSFIAGLKNSEEVSVSLNLDTKLTTADLKFQGLLKGDVEADAVVSYVITFISGAKVTFDAVATGFKVGDVNAEGKIDATFTCQPTGKPVWSDL